MFASPRVPLSELLLYACDDLPEQRPCQVAFGEMQCEVSSAPGQNIF